MRRVCSTCIQWCRWDALTELAELDLGETQRLSSGALQALSDHNMQLALLTGLVNAALPPGLGALLSLQALEIRWFQDADAGMPSPCANLRTAASQHTKPCSQQVCCTAVKKVSSPAPGTKSFSGAQGLGS